MSNLKRMYTRDGLAVFGRDGVVEFDRSRRYVHFHHLSDEAAGEPCHLMEAHCDASPLLIGDEIPDVSEGELFALLEDLYARETR